MDQSRLVPFFTDYGIADEIGARFELLTFHVSLLVTQLKSLPPGDPRHEQALDTAQALFDAFLLALDSTLREQGTGDLTVPKKMKKLGIIIYTRMKRWDDLWRDQAALADQADYAARTLYAGSDYDAPEHPGSELAATESPDLAKATPSHDIMDKAQAFARYADRARTTLNLDDILSGQVQWTAPAPLPSPETAEA